LTKDVKKLKETSETIAIVPFVGETATVTYNIKQTISIPNTYENVSIYCGVSLPCYIEDIENAKQQAVDIVSFWHEKEVDEVYRSLEENK